MLSMVSSSNNNKDVVVQSPQGCDEIVLGMGS